MVQMVLNSADLVVDPEDFRKPIAAFWEKYREQPKAARSTAVPPGPSIVYGRWAVDGSWWQSIRFLAPLVGLAVFVATGIWQRV
jgi:hypothetical protein